jgi:hypothetical protein
MTVYRDLRWNVLVAPLMAVHGVAVAGLPLILVINAVVASDDLATFLMSASVAVSAGYPFTRSIAGKVWTDGSDVFVRNPFRTLRMPCEEITGVTTQSLWQNFFAVASFERSRRQSGRPQKLIPVPHVDAQVLAERLDKPVR